MYWDIRIKQKYETYNSSQFGGNKRSVVGGDLKHSNIYLQSDQGMGLLLLLRWVVVNHR